MITSTKDWQGYRNELTKYLDEHLIKCDGCIDLFSNYIYDEPFGDQWGIRVPGATRGHVVVKNGTITEIELYEDSFCYKDSVWENLTQFIGKEIDL